MLGFAANFLYTLTGKRPDDVMEKAFDVALILHADHEAERVDSLRRAWWPRRSPIFTRRLPRESAR